MNILHSIDQSLIQHGFSPISPIINSKEGCVHYIADLLGKTNNYINYNKITISRTLESRIKHVVFTFGLGILVSSFQKIDDYIEECYKAYACYGNDFTFESTWLVLCLYHDYGYFIAGKRYFPTTLRQFHLHHSIFEENEFCLNDYYVPKHRHGPRYSEKLFRAYYHKMAIKNKKANNGEVGDHGILGGYVLYSEITDFLNNYHGFFNPNAKSLKFFIVNSSSEDFYRDVCYRIMEHNIWKGIRIVSNGVWSEIDPAHFKKITKKKSLCYFCYRLSTPSNLQRNFAQSNQIIEAQFIQQHFRVTLRFKPEKRI